MGHTLTIICEHCGKEFESNRKKRFCSDYCMHKHRYEKLSEQIKEYQKNYREQNKKQITKENVSCVFCGSDFIPQNKNQKFCSDDCRIKFYNSKRKKYIYCIVCGEKIPEDRGSKYCSDRCRDKAHVKNCEICGKEFISNHEQKYCSHECASKAQKNNTLYVCKQCKKTFHRKKSIKDQCLFCSRECAIEYKATHKPMVQKEFYFGIHTICKQCGKSFFAWNNSTQYCSEECKNKWKEEHALPIRIYFHECQQCGKRFVSPQKNRKFCSNKCQIKSYDKKHEIRRRTRKKDNGNADYTISLEKLFRRDHGICAICGLPVDMDSNPNSNEYGSIDHIIPLAKGGKHVWENVQLAHRMCNSIKRDIL